MLFRSEKLRNRPNGVLPLMRESVSRARGNTPFGRLRSFSKAALEPDIMGYAPTIAIRRVLERAGLSVGDIGVVELNEAFAAQAIAVIRDAGLNEVTVNPNGGAIALGHPIGATGAILTLKLLHEMQRTQSEWGLVTMCIGGGQAVAGVFQAIS